MITGTFLVLLGILALEGLRFPLEGEPVPPDFLIGLLTSVPFLLLVGYGGRWLARSEIPEDRQGRIVVWMFGGLALFVGINSVIMPFFPRSLYYEYVAWVRWAAAIGGGVGLLIGMFEARAIDRELTAERERVKSEELATKNDRLDEFAAILSHDLRSPLNVASGNIDLAKQEHESDRLDAAANALSRMDEIIQETLLLARSGQVIGETEPVDLRRSADDCWRNVDTADATLHVDDPPTVATDADRLRHLFENVFRNCVEHGSRNSGGASRLDETLERGTSEARSLAGGGRGGSAGSSVAITVGACPGGFYIEDDGPGIPEEDRKTVFDTEFSTADDGNGFGLAIVRQIAGAHGWTVGVTEAESGGARFEFTDVQLEE